MIISPRQKAVQQSRRGSLSFSLSCISFHKVTKLKAKEMFIRKLSRLSLWYCVCPIKAKWWLIAVGNTNGCNVSFACCFSASRACIPTHGPTIPAGSAVCITASWQKKNIQHSRTTPPEVHMFTMCFPASPFEDSTGSICKCFLSILEKAVESCILESNSANSARIKTCNWLRPPMVSSSSRRVEITFPQNYRPC